ncbi:MAG: thermonuclease family protein [Myxococcales bacterium]|nr:thermonuclease family protein [Myxococcales bacterium]
MARRFDVSPLIAFRVVTAILFLATAYFTVSVQLRRGRLQSLGRDAIIASGTGVERVQVLDGDEVSVRAEGETFIVRLLGVQCFDDKVYEPGIASHGAACRRAFERALDAGGLTIEFESFARDVHGRVLAYLHAGGIDIGAHLIAEGLGVVRTSHAFGRETDYLALEQAARARGLGVWGDARIVERINGLKSGWAEARSR